MGQGAYFKFVFQGADSVFCDAACIKDMPFKLLVIVDDGHIVNLV